MDAPNAVSAHISDALARFMARPSVTAAGKTRAPRRKFRWSRVSAPFTGWRASR